MSDELRDQITDILDEYSIHAAVSLDHIAELIVHKLAIVADGDSKDYTDNCNLARAALTALEAEPSINWRDDPEAIVEDDEPQIGRGYT